MKDPHKEPHQSGAVSANAFYRIVLADDHDFFREDVKRILMKKPDLKVVGEVRDGIELLNTLPATNPHMVILDIRMPRLSGLDAALEMSGAYPEIDTLILTMHKNAEYVWWAFSAGVRGYILKERVMTDLLPAIEIVRQGGLYISPPLGFGTHRD